MADHSTLAKIRQRLQEFIANRCPAREEQRALARGWQVERRRFGRRVYRDPRFGALKSLAALETDEIAEAADVSWSTEPPESAEDTEITDAKPQRTGGAQW